MVYVVCALLQNFKVGRNVELLPYIEMGKANLKAASTVAQATKQKLTSMSLS